MEQTPSDPLVRSEMLSLARGAAAV
uniref:Uncharacterized protein n=1 Tax=Arundo donax TaxID=35708 RepID=A0A0A8YJU7_ARUDO